MLPSGRGSKVIPWLYSFLQQQIIKHQARLIYVQQGSFLAIYFKVLFPNPSDMSDWCSVSSPTKWCSSGDQE